MALTHYTPYPSNVLFVDANYIKSISTVNHNLDENLIRPNIMLAQDKYVLPILGSGVMGEIKQQISDGSISAYTANTLVLNEFIQPVTAYWTLYEMVPTLVWRLQNKGLEKKNSENSVSPTIAEITFMQDGFKSSAMFYSQRLSQFMKENQDLYPLYYNPGSGIDIMNPNSTSYPGGSALFVPGAGRISNGSINPIGWGLTTNDLGSIREIFGL